MVAKAARMSPNSMASLGPTTKARELETSSPAWASVQSLLAVLCSWPHGGVLACPTQVPSLALLNAIAPSPVAYDAAIVHGLPLPQAVALEGARPDERPHHNLAGLVDQLKV